MPSRLVEYLKLLVGDIASDECIRWLGPLISGRPAVRYERHTYSAARLIFQIYRGHVLKNDVIRQTCKHLWCINPRHLEAVNRAEVQKNVNDNG